MLNENFYIFIVYALVYICLTFFRRVTALKRIGGALVSISLILFFVGIFKYYLYRDLDFVLLFILSSLFLICVSESSYRLNDIYIYYTLFWTGMFYCAHLIKLETAIFHLGIIPLTLFKKSKNIAFINTLLWLVALLLFLSIEDMSVMNNLMIKDSLISLLFLIIFIFIFSLYRINISKVLLFPFTVGIFNVMAEYYGYLPRLFIVTVLVMQGYFLLKYVLNKDVASLLLNLSIFGILLTPHLEAISYIQISLLFLVILLILLDNLATSRFGTVFFVLYVAHYTNELLLINSNFNALLNLSTMFAIIVIFMNIYQSLSIKQKMTPIDF